MAIITWQNSAGTLGSYPAGSSVNLQFTAISDDPSSLVYYKLLSGELPLGTKQNPISIDVNGYLTGTFDAVVSKSTYTFTVRAYDQYNVIRDRTFSITVNVSNQPRLTSTPGLLTTVNDSTWTNFQIGYANPVTTNPVTISCTAGTLPIGMYVTSTGKIQGYAEPPVNSVGSPINKRYTFTIQLESPLGNDSVVYSIDVINQRFTKPPHSRVPVIYNSRPLHLPLSPDDPYYRFYLGSDNVIPTINGNEYFTFKVLGKDFDGDAIKYNFGGLPTGLVGDSNTGWITGTPVCINQSITDYVLEVSVSKLSRPLVTSVVEKLHLRVINQVKEDIEWTSPEDLGIIYNNTISELFVNATSSRDLNYFLADGNLPPNLFVMSTGEISGRVSFQPTSEVLAENTETEFIFTITAFATNMTSLRSSKTFKITVKQYYVTPIENIYFKVTPSIQARNILNELLTDTNLIPTDYLYRPDDFYFGKSSYIKIIQAYGMYSSNLQEYLNAIQRNHYNRNITLGPVKTARALDDNGNVVYEVVYSEIIDDLVNNEGVSIPEEITWPTTISLNLGPYTINNTEIFSSSSIYYTSLSPGSVRVLYPASVDNMRNEVVSIIGNDPNNLLLPKWMTSQQENGQSLGFVKCWVICYTLPGKSSVIQENINNWSYSLNEIDCTFDRYIVDKTATHTWNTQLLVPAWTELPSEVPDYVNPDKYDLIVLFSRKTILPKSNT